MAWAEERAGILSVLMIVDFRFLAAPLRSDWSCYRVGAACGIATGWAKVEVDDPLFTALLVVSSCLLLGMLRPCRPWRWGLTVGVFIPLTELAYWVRTVKPSRAQIYGSFLAFLPGTAGAHGGAVMRRVVDNWETAGGLVFTY